MERPSPILYVNTSELQGDLVKRRAFKAEECKRVLAELNDFCQQHQVRPLKYWLGADTDEEILKMDHKKLRENVKLMREHFMDRPEAKESRLFISLTGLSKYHAHYQRASTQAGLDF